MLLALLLAATPVSLQLDLSKQTRERIGQRLDQAITERLTQEGFERSSPAKIQLRVEELHGVIKLSASVATKEPLSAEVKATGAEWKDELTFEISQRLCFLAHEAERLVPPPRVATATEPEPEPEPGPQEPAPAVSEEPPPAEEPTPPPPQEPAMRFSAGVRAGVSLRFPPVDPTFAVHGALAGGVIEPLALVGLTLSPGTGLFATELPLAVGARLPFVLSTAWRLQVEALVGARIHIYGPSSFDEGGVRADFLGLAGATVSRVIEKFRFGLRLGVEVSAGREHLAGDQRLWLRGPFSLTVQLVIERW